MVSTTGCEMDEKVFNTLADFAAKPGQGRYAYKLAMFHNGEVKFYERTHQPCYGEMRIYNPKGWKPGDLHSPFPDGNPVGVSVNLLDWPENTKTSAWDFSTHEESLWWPLLEGRFVPVKGGFVMTDTNFDSDYWFSFLLSIRAITSNGKRFEQYRKADVSQLTAWVAAMQSQPASATETYLMGANTYSMAYPCCWENLMRRTPKTFQGGTFFDRATVRDQPDNMASRIWSGPHTWSTLMGVNEKKVSTDVFLKEYLPALEKMK